MYIPWEWIEKSLNLIEFANAQGLTEKLVARGLECETHLRDEVQFINFTTFSNRKDLRSWLSILREIETIIGSQSKEKRNRIASRNYNSREILVRIESKKVEDYNLLVLKNVSEQQTSILVKSTLKANGIREISPLVDAANFVMLETGQPFHVFDLDKLNHGLTKKEVVIRDSLPNESFTDLRGKKIVLGNEDLVITDNKKIICLAGIIGDNETAVSQSTTNFMIESARFEKSSLERTCNSKQIETKASKLFTESIPFSSPLFSLKRLEQLIHEEFGLSQGTISNYLQSKKKERSRSLAISHKYIEEKLGFLIDRERVNSIFKQLNLDCEKRKASYQVTIPSYRKDINDRDDLIEELTRLIDYNQITGKHVDFQNKFFDERVNWEELTKEKIETMLLNSGFQEVISYSLVNEGEADSVKIENPLRNEQSFYRKNFFEGNLAIVARSLNSDREDISLWESGNIYSEESKAIKESQIISLLTTGNLLHSEIHSLKIKGDYYWIKGIIENIFDVCNIEFDGKVVNQKNEQYQTNYVFLIDGTQVAKIVEFNEKFLEKKEIRKKVYGAQVELSLLLDFCFQQRNKRKQFKEISSLPISRKDISFLIEKKFTLAEIEQLIKKNSTGLLKGFKIFDRYKNLNNDNTRHSLSFRLEFQGNQKNTTNEEINLVVNKIIEELKKKFSIVERI